MRTAIIMASGASLSDEDVEYVRQCDAIKIAVSDVGLLKAPWADALCAFDSAWWLSKKGSFDFAGTRYCGRDLARTTHFDIKKLGIPGGTNSGLFAMYIAREIYKTERIILLGFDMHRRNGQHFFGEHVEVFNGRVLCNTDEKIFKIHLRQFDLFHGCEVINCTQGSDLKRFPFGNLRDII